MGRQDAPLGAPLSCSRRGVSPKGPPMIDRGRLDMLVTRTLQLDLYALPIRDRAALRLLTRADAATASQLARLIYRRERTAQERLLERIRAGPGIVSPIRCSTARSEPDRPDPESSW